MRNFVDKICKIFYDLRSPIKEMDVIKPYKAIEIVKNEFDRCDIGKLSDGYHTFDELYHHRAVLFAVICNNFKELAWKSKLHDTGDMFDGMFIVGINTPEGQATYHYDIDPYWDMFKVKELDKAPKWDGHTPEEALRRITFLDDYMSKNNGWIKVEDLMPQEYEASDESRDYFKMFSNTVIVTIVDGDGKRRTHHANTTDGRWRCKLFMYLKNPKVIAWKPMPEPMED